MRRPFEDPGRSGSRWEVTGSVRQLRALVNPLDGNNARSEDPAVRALSISVVPSELVRAPKMLLVMDVDSTLIKQEVIELLAAHAGCEDEVTEVTEAAMRGDLDFAQSLHTRVKMLAGLDVAVIEQVRSIIELSDGARELIPPRSRRPATTLRSFPAASPRSWTRWPPSWAWTSPAPTTWA